MSRSSSDLAVDQPRWLVTPGEIRGRPPTGESGCAGIRTSPPAPTAYTMCLAPSTIPAADPESDHTRATAYRSSAGTGCSRSTSRVPVPDTRWAYTAILVPPTGVSVAE
ncbi:hypothetical protein OOK41_00015 [Micromonospora sp. NBC_01655]|uniref:hypothetical protein n=1 Tax=Micromonospora sp. NBC_01655 TaxID=2975983 RepID=UPI00225005AE|nr:hypothetical protein [Micromonospora sp. NBC_01655]MCX4468715.1 hypothetical protein [Micromonospora sp. NBC_01655]